MCEIKDVNVNDFSFTGKEMLKTLTRTSNNTTSKNSRDFKKQVKKYIYNVKSVAS